MRCRRVGGREQGAFVIEMQHGCPTTDSKRRGFVPRHASRDNSRGRARWLLGAPVALAILAGCAAQSPVAEPPQPSSPPPGIAVPPAFPPSPGRRPEPGEYVYVDELPEAILKVDPPYPEEARRAGIEGIVLVQALVLEDGSVGDWRIVNSIPALDEAAVVCVRQWRFKPALSKGVPVAVWVATPIQFKK